MYTSTTQTISLELYDNSMHEEVSYLLARSFINNPLNMLAFGPDALAVNAHFYKIALRSFKGKKIVALEDKRIVGFIHWADSKCCQLSLVEKMLMAPSIIMNLGINTIPLSRWMRMWSQHDPATDHLHLGPLAVDTLEQGRGIGGLLMKHFCHNLNNAGVEGYLETDRLDNLSFYSQYGFKVVKEITVLGIKNYLMIRNC